MLKLHLTTSYNFSWCLLSNIFKTIRTLSMKFEQTQGNCKYGVFTNIFSLLDLNGFNFVCDNHRIIIKSHLIILQPCNN